MPGVERRHVGFDGLMARVVGNSGQDGICVTIDRKEAMTRMT